VSRAVNYRGAFQNRPGTRIFLPTRPLTRIRSRAGSRTAMAPVTCNRLSSFWPFAAVAAAAATSAYPESRGCAKTSVSPRRLVRLCGSLQFSGGWSFFACSYRCSSRRLRWAAEAPVRGRTSRTCARARAASCRHAASLRSSVVATSLNEKSNTSCSRKAARSSGDSRSSVKSSAMDKSSASCVFRRCE